jgi:uncharacterized membrane protein
MLELVSDFIVKYYFTGGYNIVNTVTYGLVLGLLTFKILIPALRPIIGKIDRDFVLMVLPFILYGSTMREMVDQEMGVYAGHTAYPGNWFFVAPGIYFTMFAITMLCVFAGLAAKRLVGWDHRRVAGGLGWALFAYNLALIVPMISHPELAPIMALCFLAVSAILYTAKVALRLSFLDKEGNFLIILVHMFDATTTFVGVDVLGFFEKHVVPTLFINVFHTAAVMYPLKLLVLVPALWVIDDELKDDEFARRFVKFVIVVLGAGPAVRNTSLMLLGAS